MKIVGIKLTHDAAVALIDDGRLIFSIEEEKIENNPRYSSFNLKNFSIEKVLNSYGYSMESIDRFVVDGWNNGYVHHLFNKSEFHKLELHGYDPITNGQPLLDVKTFNSRVLPIYSSYQHVSGHAIGAYCTSPFSKTLQSSYILVWDGAIGPQLYYFDSKLKEFQTIGWVNKIYGCAYAEFAHKFPPFSSSDLYDMSIPGKVMAYLAKGKIQKELLDFSIQFYNQIYLSKEGKNLDCRGLSKKVQEAIYQRGVTAGYPEDDIMTTFSTFLGELLITGLANIIGNYPDRAKKICYAGGCALNIKWNGLIRSSGIFDEVWIPPFPNDSGSAIGTACCEMVNVSGVFSLVWNLYSGPKLVDNLERPQNWSTQPCSILALSKILHYCGEPVVVLNGNAELGPRALGNRSILAPSTTNLMKATLNELKQREDFRPIAPICIEEEAGDYFFPGTSDPLMLFDHEILKNKLHLIPAVAHLDGTARLQTVNEDDNPLIYKLLKEYKNLSGIPILCNTSANFNGSGFFPDVASAIKWGKCNFIWSDGCLWYNKSNVDENMLNSYTIEDLTIPN